MSSPLFENPCLGRLFASAVPSGSIHLGELTGAIEHWVKLQENYECIFVISDVGSLKYPKIPNGNEKHDIYEMLADWLALGISPNNSIITLESNIQGLFELEDLLRNCSTFTAGKWDESFPQSSFLAEALEILLFRADTIPVTTDLSQNGFAEAQKLRTGFNQLYGEVFPSIKHHPINEEYLIGIDGYPMKRSLGNLILLKELDEETERKINYAPGKTLVDYSTRFDPNQDRSQEIVVNFHTGKLSETDLRKHVSTLLGDYLHSARVKRDKWIANPDELEAILKTGARRARAIAMETLSEVRVHMDRAHF